MNKPEYIIVHHAYMPDLHEQDSFETIKKYHTEEMKWSDIGYHYVIEYEASGFPCIKTGRAEDTSGAHALGFNDKSIGICVVGNFDDTQLSWDKTEVLVHLIQRLMKKYHIPKENVIGHRETYLLQGKSIEKSCPGGNVSMLALRREL